jgi:hypothetical protein
MSAEQSGQLPLCDAGATSCFDDQILTHDHMIPVLMSEGYQNHYEHLRGT